MGVYLLNNMTNNMKNINIEIENVTRTIILWGKAITKDYGKKVHLNTDEFTTYVHFNNGHIVESLIGENELLDLGLDYNKLLNYAK